MKKYTIEIVQAFFLILIVGGFIWFAIGGTAEPLQFTIAALIIITGMISIIRSLLKRQQDLLTGAPAEDEFTNMAKVNAGNQAFMYSLYLWLMIFAFNTSFTNNREMLGVGILGSCLIYGLCLWYYKSTGAFHEK